MLRPKAILIIVLFLAAQLYAAAQKDTCEFVLVDTLAHSTNTNYYLASNINNWNPADTAFRFKKDKDGTNYLIVITDKATLLNFKFTKGSWDNVECSKTGADIDNREIKTGTTTRFKIFYVENWKSGFTAKPKQHTASSNVHIIDTAFYIPQLKRTRRIWIYLPPNYATNGNAYPVLYMQDGQNLFDEFTTGFGEWGIDECLDTLIKNGTKPCIVVGIDCGPKRLNEYNPYDTNRFGEGEGNQYVDFLIGTLKPFIDKHYRTLPQKQHTIIAGSSMGALIAYYAALKHPNVFGKAGIFSPAFWIAPQIKQLTNSIGNKINSKLFFYVGGKEGDEPQQMIDDMMDIENRLKSKSTFIKSIVDTEGSHNEKAWRKWFPVFYKWIMSDDN